MAIFSSGKFGADTGSSALSRGRIEAALKSKQWAYQVDKDGDVGGYWSGHLFHFFVTGEKNEILHIQGRWKEALDVEGRLEVRQAIDEWHRDKFWPKAYTRVNDSGELQVYAELAVDFEPGVTDDLLAQTILCALVTSLRLFEHLAEHFGLPPSDD